MVLEDKVLLSDWEVRRVLSAAASLQYDAMSEETRKLQRAAWRILDVKTDYNSAAAYQDVLAIARERGLDTTLVAHVMENRGKIHMTKGIPALSSVMGLVSGLMAGGVGAENAVQPILLLPISAAAGLVAFGLMYAGLYSSWRFGAGGWMFRHGYALDAAENSKKPAAASQAPTTT